MNQNTVHVWGGFGSQLFGVSLALELCENSSNKDISLIFHNSGITRRNLELDLKVAPFKIVSRDDFSEEYPVSDRSGNHNFNVSTIAKWALIKSRFLNEANDVFDMNKIKPWTSIYRGHYSYRNISTDNITSIIGLFEINGFPFQDNIDDDTNSLRVHFRLGDLKTLKTSSLIAPQRIGKLLQGLAANYSPSEYLLFSDDAMEAKVLLQHESRITDFETSECGSWETIVNLTFSRIFVGTNSKLSVWAAIFRSRLNIGEISYLPIELENQIMRNLGTQRNILFY